MPTVLLIMGWRFFFYSNEGNDPIHIHCQKAEKECKYWLDTETFDIKEAYTFNMNNKDKRQVKKIIFEYFEFIESEWSRFQKEKNQ
jgi:formylmethanofuran dehydrogenase subunit A